MSERYAIRYKNGRVAYYRQIEQLTEVIDGKRLDSATYRFEYYGEPIPQMTANEVEHDEDDIAAYSYFND